MNNPKPKLSEVRIKSYYQTISAIGKEVMKEKRAQGEVMHLAPLGYKNARDELGRSIIVPDPETYELVQKARELRVQGISIRKICQEMETMGLRSKKGRVISPMVMWEILKGKSTHIKPQPDS